MDSIAQNNTQYQEPLTLIKRPNNNQDNKWVDVYDFVRDTSIVPVPYVIDGLLRVGLTNLTGLAKVGKSLLLSTAAVAVASGRDFLGRSVLMSGTVVYLSLENWREDEYERLRNFTGIYGIEHDRFRLHFEYDRMKTAGHGGIERLDSELDDLKRHGKPASLVVVDMYRDFLPDKTTKAQRDDIYGSERNNAIKINDLAHKHSVAVLTTDHGNGRPWDQDDPFRIVRNGPGNSGGTGANWVMHSPFGQKSSNGDTIATMYMKGRGPIPHTIQMRMDGATGMWLPTDTEQAEVKKQLEIRQTTAERIMVLFDQQLRWTLRELLNALTDVQPGAVRIALYRLTRNGGPLEHVPGEEDGVYQRLI